jgi:hypothetical protein
MDGYLIYWEINQEKDYQLKGDSHKGGVLCLAKLSPK